MAQNFSGFSKATSKYPSRKMQTTISAASSIIAVLPEPFAAAKINNGGNEECQRHEREQQVRHGAPHWKESGTKTNVMRQPLRSNEMFIRIL